MRRDRSDFLKTSDVDLSLRNIAPGFGRNGELAKEIHLSRPGFDTKIEDLNQEQIDIKFDNVGANWRALNQNRDEVEALREMMREREKLVEALANGAGQEEEILAEHYDDDDQAEDMDEMEDDDKSSKNGVVIEESAELAHRPQT